MQSAGCRKFRCLEDAVMHMGFEIRDDDIEQLQAIYAYHDAASH